VAALPGWATGAVQALGFDSTGARLSCDGKAGPKTLGGTFCIPDAEELGRGDAVAAMLGFVREQRRESGVNNAGDDVAYMFYDAGSPALVGYRGQWLGAWCAATVSRALLLAGTAAHLGFRRIVGARALADWFADRGGEVRAVDVEVGDIVSWSVPRKDAVWGGHIGIVCMVDGDDVYVVEGNGAAARGQVRVYKYRKPLLAYGAQGQHKLWRVVRPSRARSKR
jgi:hypothetical protein